LNNQIQIIHTEGKLDTGGSVSLSHSSFLRDIKDCKEYGVPKIKLSGIGGATPTLNKAGLLHVQREDKSIVKYIMYVFDTKVGSTEKMLLFSLKAIRQSDMHIVHHMDKSLLGQTAPLRFMVAPPQAKCKRKRASVYSAKTNSQIFLMLQEKIKRGKTPPRMYVKASKIFKKHLKEAKENKELENAHSNRLGVELFSIGEVEGHHLLMLDSTAQDEDTYRIEDAEESQACFNFVPVSSRRRHSVLAPILTYETLKGLPENLQDQESLMTEIQLRRIVDRVALNKSEAVTDGDETMVKDGVTISKFSKESIHLGDSVLEKFKEVIFSTYDKCVGQDGVFPTKNGAPKIMTKFINNPYSYELLDEYKNGTKKLPSVKAMDWHGKTANAYVIRSFAQATPVVEPCPNPRTLRSEFRRVL